MSGSTPAVTRWLRYCLDQPGVEVGQPGMDKPESVTVSSSLYFNLFDKLDSEALGLEQLL